MPNETSIWWQTDFITKKDKYQRQGNRFLVLFYCPIFERKPLYSLVHESNIESTVIKNPEQEIFKKLSKKFDL